MFQQKDAILKLLQDDDPYTVGLVKSQLAEKGPEAIPSLTDLLATDDQTVARHVREVLAQIDTREAGQELSLLCSFFPENGDIEAASWLLARVLLPGCDVAGAKRQIDHWGERVAKITAGVDSAAERVRHLSDFLGNGLNFRGNSDDYYDPKNSLLPSLLQSRLGIPISLTLLYMLVGRRAGIEIGGVNFPGHFLARHEKVIFDPFERGRTLSPADCEAILERQNLVSKPAYFAAASPLAMLTRILANLLYIHQAASDEAQTERLGAWVRALTVR